MSTKERLHQIIDEMNDDQAAVLLMDLEDLRPRLSDEDRAAIEEGLKELRDGRGIPHEEAMRRLGLSQ